MSRKREGDHPNAKREDEVIDNIIREIFGPDVNLEFIDKDAVSSPASPPSEKLITPFNEISNSFLLSEVCPGLSNFGPF